MELVVKDVHVTLGKAKIVNGVSLHVGERQSVGIIGPNGCGKSTLLKAIYRVNPIDSGEVLLNGQNVTKMSPKEAARHIAVVGQFNELAFDFSVQDMVLMGRSPHKKMMESYSEADYKLVEDTLRKTELYPLRQRSYLSLSGGEKQRVILARAIVQQPELLILDEPTNHLDIKFQFEVLNLVKDLNNFHPMCTAQYRIERPLLRLSLCHEAGAHRGRGCAQQVDYQGDHPHHL